MWPERKRESSCRQWRKVRQREGSRERGAGLSPVPGPAADHVQVQEKAKGEKKLLTMRSCLWSILCERVCRGVLALGSDVARKIGFTPLLLSPERVLRFLPTGGLGVRDSLSA